MHLLYEHAVRSLYSSMASRGSLGFVGSIADSRRDNTIGFLSFGKGMFSTRKRLSHGALQRFFSISIWSA